MSSFARRVQIRALKKRGYRRTKYIIVKDAQGRGRLQPVSKGGLMLDPKHQRIGTRWPGLARRAA